MSCFGDVKKSFATLATCRRASEIDPTLGEALMTLDAPPIRSARTGSPKLARARMLAAEIEELLVGLTPDETGGGAYPVRLAQGLTRSLIDQLEEIDRCPRGLLDVGSRTAPAYTVRSAGR